MDISDYEHSDSISIKSGPEEVYAIVSDVTRIGELSPVCQSGAWDDPAQAGQEGAWFTGHNALGDFTWDTHCKVLVAAPGKEFTFVNYGPNGDVELVRWGYAFDGVGEGTEVTESWKVLPAYPDFVSGGDPNFDVKGRIEGMAQMARDGIRDTLARLKLVAEA